MDNVNLDHKIDLSVSVQVDDVEELKKSFAGLAKAEDLNLNPDLMYARFIMCHEGANANGDFFTNEVLKQASSTPKYKPIDWEHGQPMIGTMLDSRYAEDENGRGYIEAVGVIWKFIYPELAEAIKEQSSSGGLKLSMECYYKDANYKYGDQIFDQKQASLLGLENYVGNQFNGQTVYRVFSSVVFGGVGVVANPADKDAVFLSVAKKKAEEAINKFNTVELDENQIKAIAEQVIRTMNDFKEKIVSDETVEATTVAQFIKAFDRAKSSLVAQFNQSNLYSKEQAIECVDNVMSQLQKDITDISYSFYSPNQTDPFPNTISPADKTYTSEGGKTMDLEKRIADLEAELTKVKADNINLNAELESVKTEKDKVIDAFNALQERTDNLQVELTTVNKEKDFAVQASEQVKSELVELKTKVEATEKEAKATKRVSELKEAGIVIPESRFEKEFAKLGGMSDEDFADHKEFLVEVAGSKVDSTQEGITVQNQVASAGLNVELTNPKAVKPFGHLG